MEKLTAAFIEADNAWRKELVAVIGIHAEHFSRTSIARGEVGTELRTAWNARTIASDAWTTAKQYA